MRSLKALAVSIGVMMVLVGSGVAVARSLFLPATACTIDRNAADTLEMPQPYAQVRDRLGCDGVLVARDDWGDIRHERYQWRGKAWPFGRLDATFYNGALHGMELVWLSVAIEPTPSPDSRP